MKKIITGGLLAIMALTAGVGIARAAGGSEQVRSCVRPDGTRPRLLMDAGGQCAANEKEVAWNIQGPAGPQGPTGPQGPSGTSTVFVGSKLAGNLPSVLAPIATANLPLGRHLVTAVVQLDGSSNVLSARCTLVGVTGQYTVGMADASVANSQPAGTVVRDQIVLTGVTPWYSAAVPVTVACEQSGGATGMVKLTAVAVDSVVSLTL